MPSDLQVTNLKANDGTAGISIADSSGNVSLSGSLSAGTLGSDVVLPANRIRQFSSTTITSQPTRTSTSFGAFSSAITGSISGCLSSSKILIECHCTFSSGADSIMMFHFYDVTNSAWVTPAGDDGHFGGSSTDSTGGRVSNGSGAVLYDPASYNSGSLVIELYGKGSSGTMKINIRGGGDAYGRGTTVINLYEVTQ